MRMNVQEMANSINKYVDDYDYFWAYGLIRETYKLWNEENKQLLNDVALTMLNNAAYDPKTAL